MSVCVIIITRTQSRRMRTQMGVGIYASQACRLININVGEINLTVWKRIIGFTSNIAETRHSLAITIPNTSYLF